MQKTKEFLEYLDMFGTRPGFYTSKKPKFYTLLGGILSIITIIISITVFIAYSLENSKTSRPTTISSSIRSVGYEKIKMGEEKIWLPFRIIDYYKNYINHEGLIYPIIKYKYDERKNISEQFKLKTKFLNIKLCNETSMNNKSEIYTINVPLNKLYCIDMDDLIIGGSWNSIFIGFIKLELYLCKNGIDYNENNSDCTTYNDIIKKIGNNNSLEFEIYFPQIQIQPSNQKKPITVNYKQYFYHISKYSNKIARAFLKRHVFIEDLGWIKSKIYNCSYWGLSNLIGDTYVTSLIRDLINESSTSRFYSLNIYLDQDIILYERRYKKFYLLLTESIPIVYTVFIIFQNIANVFKLTEQNKNMTELLFENLKRKSNKFQKHLKNLFQENQNKMSPILQNEDNKNNINFGNIDKSNSVNNSYINIQLNKKEEKNDMSGLELKIHKSNSKINLNKFENVENSKLKINHSIKNKQLHGSVVKENLCLSSQIRYVRTEVFPYSYYFFAIFLKNCTIKKNSCFSSKFAKVHAYLSQILDISAYLLLQREFNILITEILEDKNQKIIKKNQKINVGSYGFMRYINGCIDNNENQILKNSLK